MNYSHLDLSDSDIDALAEADPICQGFKDRIAQFELKIKEYEEKRLAHRAELEKLQNEEAELNAQLKVNNMSQREVRGHDASEVYQIRLAQTRIKQRNTSIATRRRHLLRQEVRKRLAGIGREIKREGVDI